MALQVLTANRLSDGCVVWYGGEVGWIEDAAGAVIARDEGSKATLELAAKEAVAANLVVEAELIDVEARKTPAQNETFYALRLRERIRQAGPSIAYGLSARNYSQDREGEADVSL